MANRFRAASAILALAIAGWAMTGIGCGDGLSDCNEAEAQVEAKLEACHQPFVVDDSVDYRECSDAAGAILLCQARAVQELSCDCVRGDMTKCTPAEMKIFGALFIACY